MAPQDKSQWDHPADKDLLLTIIDQKGKDNTFKWDEISAIMAQKGYSFTKEACRQHFQKIRKESRAGNTTNGSGPSGVQTPTKRARTNGSTPSKAKANGTASKHNSFTNNGSFTTTGYAEDDDEDEDMTSPSKRKKMIKKEENVHGQQTASIFKHEDLSCNGVVDLENADLYEA